MDGKPAFFSGFSCWIVGMTKNTLSSCYLLLFIRYSEYILEESC